MATVIDSTGLFRDRLDAIIANFNAALRGIYGQNIDVNPSSKDGQFVGACSEMLDTLAQLLEEVYDSRSVTGATGASLSRLVRLIGIQRNVASASTAAATFTGTPATVIPAGSLVDSTNVPPAHFKVQADVTLDGTGAGTGVLVATTTGPVFADAGKLTAIKTAISGWATVTNPAAVNLGSDQETDAALRVRRAPSVALYSKSILDGIYAAITNVQGVSEAVVFENRTGSPISRPGSADLPANSIQCVVRGGLDADIAAAIWSKASAGVTLVGAVQQAVVDAQGTPQIMKFDRPTDIPISATVYFSVPNGYSVSNAQQDAVKVAIVSFGNSVARTGKPVVWSSLIAPVAAVIMPPLGLNIVLVGSLNIAPVSAVDIPMPFTSRPSWDVSRVSVGFIFHN